mmetsp:Transcript_72785/g.190827  ORF Transcript_72785/g.190827 Transcript_72785/m.190827 type:complete len:298 (+) Transcript_72785:379-1272(+)
MVIGFGAASSFARENAVISPSFARSASSPCWATSVTRWLSSLMLIVFSCEVAIFTPALDVICSKTSRRLSSDKCARLAANAADATPSASPSAVFPEASLWATSSRVLVCCCLLKASASARRRAHSASVLDFTSRSAAMMVDFNFETSSSAFVITCSTSAARVDSSSAMSRAVCATTSAVSLVALFFTTSPCCSAAILELSHSSRSFCFPSSLFSKSRSYACFMRCSVVFDSKSVFSSLSSACCCGIFTFCTVKWWIFTPSSMNLLFNSSTMCCVLVPKMSLMLPTSVSIASPRRASS